jgi:hypothetical protein
MSLGRHSDALFTGPSKDLVDLGELYLPTGKLYCCDPFLSFEVGPLERTLDPGNYRVRVLVPEFVGWGRRVAAAVLLVGDARPTRWEEAIYRAADSVDAGFRVDAGLACFMDAATRDVFVEVLESFYSRFPNGNYYDEILAGEFAHSADPARPRHAGDWTIHYPIRGDPRNIAMFASGLGDGVYIAEWGLDAEDYPAALAVDFGVEDLELDPAWQQNPR